jgi:hypothetical protein
MEARLAAQIEVVTKALLKRTPSADRLSITGVLIMGCPAQPSVSLRWSSTSRKRMLGLELDFRQEKEPGASIAAVVNPAARRNSRLLNLFIYMSLHFAVNKIYP